MGLLGSSEEQATSHALTERGALSPAVGKILTSNGPATIVRADGSAVPVEAGALLHQGDVIETGDEGRAGIAFEDGTTFDLSNNSRIALADFGYDSEKALHSALVRVSQGSFAFRAGKAATHGGVSIDTPFATLRSGAMSGALVTLTLAAVTVALLQKLEAASNEPILLDDLIKYKDLEHGTLGIVPKGGERRLIILDDPEMTIIIGPPETGYTVQEILNSSAAMSFLLAVSQEANAIYLLGQADPFTTGSIPGQRADSGIIFFPDTLVRPVNFFQPLPSVSDDGPPGDNSPNPPPANVPPQQTLVLTLNENLVVEHDQSLELQVDPGDDIDAPFPIDLGDLEGFDLDLVIGQASDGTAGDPFVSTAGSSGPVRITVEPSSNGVYSGLDVTGGGRILLFKEFTDGQQVVVGREEGTNKIAFIIFVTPDGRSLWVQELLPIHHTDPDDSPNDPDSIVSILDNVLLVRGTLIGTSLTQTAPIGNHVAFVDDAPTLDVVATNEASVLLTTQDAETDGNPPSEDSHVSTANFGGVFSIANQSFGTDGPGIAPTLSYTLSLTVEEGTASGLFSNGAAINLYDIGGIIFGSTAATEGAVVPANTIFTLSVSANGTVTQTQFAEVDHDPPGEASPPYDDQFAILSDGLVSLTASATISDGDTDTASDSAFIDLGGNIRFADDGPTAAPVTENLVEKGADTNVLLIFDVSGSMGDSSGLTNLTRLDLAKAAANELLEQYESQGDVRVQIITFSDTAAKQGNVWLTVDAAKAYISGLSAGGASDYNDATALAPDAFDDDGKLTTPGVRNVSYFFSDNSPTSGDALLAGDITNWTAFLNNNDILSYALGMGTGVGTTALNPIAYDGRGAGSNTNASTLTNPSLTPFLAGSSTIPPESGTLVPPGSFGADGGFVKSITIDGTTYTYDPAANGGEGGITSSPSGAFSFDTATNTLTVTLASLATFAIDMDDGSYTYTPPPSVNSDLNEQIGFTLSDGDFDTASNTLTITVADADLPPMARDDLVITNINGNGASIVIPDFALLYNDVDPNGQAIAVKSVSAPSSGTVTDNIGSVTFTDGAGSENGGSFTYTGETQPPVAGPGDEDNARVTVNRAQDNDNPLQGTGLGEILIGRTNTADTINGFAGDDVLIGGGGADWLFGGAGNDLLVYAQGVAFIDGGSNSSNNLLTVGNRGDILSVSGEVDFTSLGDIFQNIETISMLARDGSAGDSTITLSITDVLQMADTGRADIGSGYSNEPTLRIDGSAGDVLNLADDSGTWLLATGTSGVPAGYNAYAHVGFGSSTPSNMEDAYLFVATGITVNGVGP